MRLLRDGSAAVSQDVQPRATAVASRIAPTAEGRALTTRFLDFWLLGGASVLVWVVMWVLQDFRSLWAIDSHFTNLTVTTISLSLLVNNPHFLISYKLAYSRGVGFILAQWWQLLAVPAVLLAFLAVAFVGFTAPTATTVPYLPSVAGTLSAWGANTAAMAAPQLGDVLFTLAFNLMFFTVGWHYTKQAFGCMMLYAHLDGYRLTPRQRSVIKWNLLSIAWLNLAYGSRHGGPLTFSHYTYYAVDLPDVLVPVSACLLAVGLVLVVWTVFYRKYVEDGQRPTLNMLVPFVAMYVWWMPFMRQHEFYFLLIPFFHSLQYLVVAGKLEHARLQGSAHYEMRATVVVVAVIVAGWLAFDLVPSMLDRWLGTFDRWHIFFFFTAAMLFINIHHYFIDNALWRFRDPVVKRYLLA
jgi:hypothetical protein